MASDLITGDVFQRITLEKILSRFSMQAGKENSLCFVVLKKDTGFSERLLGRIGESDADFCGEKMKLKEFMYDYFVLSPLSLREIAEILKMNSHSRVQQYLEATGQYERWKEGRKKQEQDKQQAAKKEQTVKQSLVNLLFQKVLQDTQENWPRHTAILVDAQKNHGDACVPIHKLEELFGHYQSAIDDKRSISLTYLREITGLDQNTIARQLYRARGKPMNPQLKKGWLKKRVRLSDAEKKRIKNSKNTFPQKDLSFFLCLPLYLQEIRKTHYPPGSKTRYDIKNFSYRLASEIYQAQGEMSSNDIKYALDLDDDIYKKYVVQQRVISKEIVTKLRKIYPELRTEIRFPYLTAEIRKLQQEQTMDATVVRAIESAREAGAKGLEQLMEITGFDHSTLCRYAQKRGIKLPYLYRKYLFR